MRISKYGVDLRILEKRDLELLRDWRNDPIVNQYLFNREHISKEDQNKWFESLDSKSSLYLIIETNKNKIGLISFKDIDWERASAESNIFIGEKEYFDTMIIAYAGLLASEFYFEFLGMEILHSNTFVKNQKANDLDKVLGYKLREIKENGIQTVVSTREDFISASKKLKRTSERLTKTKAIEISMQDSGYTLAKAMIQRLKENK